MRFLSLLFLSLFTFGCAAKFLKVEDGGKAGTMGKIEEYDQKIQVKALPVTPEVAQIVAPPAEASAVATTLIVASTLTEEKGLKKKKKPVEPPKVEAKKPDKRRPELEDAEGFVGRRPLVDPFWVGEKTTLVLSYFGVKGGDMTMEVRPFVEVNGKKSYHFAATVVSAPLFSTFYSVDDYGETFMDFEEMIPFNFLVNVKESGQLRDVRSFFDWKAKKSSFWEKKYTKKHGHQEKKLEWDIEDYAHNVFSAPFYLRTFKLVPGKKYQFRVADEGRNMVVTAHVLAKESVTVDAGTFDCVKVRPEVEIGGIFQPMGDVFFWLTDDDRRFYTKIEAKIRIGTIKAEAKEIRPGVRPSTAMNITPMQKVRLVN